MSKVTVFLSHISEESDLAVEVKKLLEEAFLGLVNVFVSSDPDSIAYGEKWLQEITGCLKTCAVELILCSPASIQQAWITFEAGAGWVREIPVIPLCHSGLDRCQLPIPLSLLQAANLSEVQGVRGALSTIAAALESNVPTIDIEPFAKFVKGFEAEYTFWSRFATAFAFGASYLAKTPVINEFVNGRTFDVELTETAITELQRGLAFLISKNLVRVGRTGISKMTATGAFYGIRLTFDPDYQPLLEQFMRRTAEKTKLGQ